MLERDIIRRVVSRAKTRGIQPIRMAMMGGVSAGWPDYLFIGTRGRSVWVEFKAPGKKPTPLQQHRIDDLRRRGQVVFVADSVDAGIVALSSVM